MPGERAPVACTRAHVLPVVDFVSKALPTEVLNDDLLESLKLNICVWLPSSSKLPNRLAVSTPLSFNKSLRTRIIPETPVRQCTVFVDLLQLTPPTGWVDSAVLDLALVLILTVNPKRNSLPSMFLF